MKKIKIIDNDNNERTIYAIRYLKCKNKKLLFYVSELRRKGVVSIRVSKVKEEVGFTKLCGINKKEWPKVRSDIRKIVKEMNFIKDKSYKELNVNELVDVKFDSFNILDIKSETFDILNTKYNDDIDYKELYKASEKENTANRKLINALTNELAEYKKRYGDLD